MVSLETGLTSLKNCSFISLKVGCWFGFVSKSLHDSPDIFLQEEGGSGGGGEIIKVLDHLGIPFLNSSSILIYLDKDRYILHIP